MNTSISQNSQNVRPSRVKKFFKKIKASFRCRSFKSFFCFRSRSRTSTPVLEMDIEQDFYVSQGPVLAEQTILVPDFLEEIKHFTPTANYGYDVFDYEDDGYISQNPTGLDLVSIFLEARGFPISLTSSSDLENFDFIGYLSNAGIPLNIKNLVLSPSETFKTFIKNSLSSFKTDLLSASGEIAVRVALVTCACAIFIKGIYEENEVYITIGTVLIGAVAIFLSEDASKAVSKILTKVNGFVSQGYIDLPCMIAELAANLFYYSAMGLYGISTATVSIKNFVSYVAILPKFHDGVNFLLDKAFLFFQSISDYILDTTADGKTFLQHRDLTKAVRTWGSRVTDLLGTPFEERDCSYDMVREYQDLCETFDVLTASSLEFKRSGAEVSYLKYYKSKLDELSPVFDGYANFRHGVRVEPCALWLYSPPGCFKTTMMNIIAQKVALAISKDKDVARKIIDNPGSVVYNQPPGDKFWSRYESQPVAMFDEADQDKAALIEAYTNFYIKLISMVNQNRFPLNMAGIEDKGKDFLSRFICMTTNIDYIPNNAQIQDIGAVKRRLEFMYEIECVKRPDPANITRITFDNVVFHERKFVANSNHTFRTGVVLSGDELVDAIVQSCKTKEVYYEKFCDTLKEEMIRTCLKTYGENAVPVTEDDLLLDNLEELYATFPAMFSGEKGERWKKTLHDFVPLPESSHIKSFAIYFKTPQFDPQSYLVDKSLFSKIHRGVLISSGEITKTVKPNLLKRAKLKLAQAYDSLFLKNEPQDLSLEAYFDSPPDKEVLFSMQNPADEVITLEHRGWREGEYVSQGFFSDPDPHEAYEEFYTRFQAHLLEQRNKKFTFITNGFKLAGTILTGYLFYVAMKKMFAKPKEPSLVPMSLETFEKLYPEHSGLLTEQFPLLRVDDGDNYFIDKIYVDFHGVKVRVYDFLPTKAQSTDNSAKVEPNNLGLRAPTYQAQSGDNASKVTPNSLGLRAAAYQSQGYSPSDFLGKDYCSVDRNLESIADSVYRKNMYRMFTPNNVFGGHVLCFKQTVCAIPKHFLYTFEGNAERFQWNPDSLFTLVSHTSDYAVTFPYSKLLQAKHSPDYDLAFFSPGRHFALHKDILPKVYAAKDHENFDSASECTIVVPARKPNDPCKWLNLPVSRQLKTVNVKTPCGRPYTVTWSYMVPRRFEQGDCGSLLFVHNTGTRSRKLAGLFFSSHTVHDRGLFTPLYSEDLEKAFNDFEKIRLPIEEPDEYVASAYNPTFFPVIEDRPIEGYLRSDRTSYVKTPLYSAWSEPTKKPTVASKRCIDGVEFDPKLNTMLSRHRIVQHIPEDWVDSASASYYAHIMNKSFENSPIRRFLTIEEAVYGIDGVFSSLDWSTYNGPSFGKLTKTQIFGPRLGKPFSGTHFKLFKEKYDSFWDKIHNQGIVPYNVVHIMFKDELLLNEKVDAGKLREFHAWDVHVYVIFRQLFGGFCDWFLRNCGLNSSALGVNPYSEVWDEFVAYLTSDSSFASIFLDGDIKKMDSSPSFAWYAPITENVVNAWYGNDEYSDTRLRATAVCCFIYAWFKFWVLKLNYGTSSGVFLTGVYNTIVLILVYMICFVYVLKIVVLPAFFRKFGLLAHGDDSVLANRLLISFDLQEMVAGFARLGFTLTPGSKDSLDWKFMPIDQITFLSRGFRFEPILSRFVGPLKTETLLQMPYYTSTSTNVLQITRDVVDICLFELALWPQELWDKYYPLISEASIKFLNYHPRYQRRTATLLSVGDSELYLACSASLTEKSPKALAYLASAPALKLVKFGPNTLTSRSGACKKPENTLSLEFSKTPIPSDAYCIEDGAYLSQGPEDNHPGGTSTAPAFVDLADAVVAENIVSVPQLTVNDLDGAFKLKGEFDLPSFFERPVKIADLTVIIGSDPQNGEIYSADFPEKLFTFLWPMYKKVEGFLGFRGTLKVKLVVNANPFTQGWLIMTYMPLGSEAGNLTKMRHRSIANTVQLPHVKLDLSCETEAVLTIPYYSCLPYYNIVTGEGRHAHVSLRVYAPSDTGAGAVITDYYAQVFAWYEDVEIVTPTIGAVYLPDIPPGLVQGDPIVAPIEVPEAAEGFVSQGPSDAEAAAQKPSTVLKNISMATSMMSRIPIVSSIARPTSWATSFLSGAASAFGYSNPIEPAPVTKTVRISNYGNLNADMPRHSQQMGLSASNTLRLLPKSSPRGQEEMSFEFISSVPGYLGNFEMAPDDTVNGAKYVLELLPTAFRYSQVIGTRTHHTFVPWSYLCYNFFTYWKATVHLTLHIVKTQYHSGRLSVEYYPGVTNADVSAVTDPWNWSSRTVVDLRECNKVELSFPMAPGFTMADRDRSAGTIIIRTLNPVTSPPTAFDKVYVHVESHATNIQFSKLSSGTMYPVIFTADAPPSSSTGYISQGPCDLGTDASNTYFSELTNDVSTLELVCGEKITSVLQLAKTLVTVSLTTTSTSTVLRPWNFDMYVIDSGTGVRTVPNYINPTHMFISLMFGFMRGSVEVSLEGSVSTSGKITTSIWTLPSSGTISTKNLAFDAFVQGPSWAPRSVSFPTESGIHSFTIPWYDNKHVSPVIPWLVTNNVNAYLPTTDYKRKLTTFGFVADVVPRILFKVGDDFQYSYFLGVPTMVETSQLAS